jgi:hypothetical protein
MLDAATADMDPVIHRLLVLSSIACCLLVAASFVMFARDQVAGASVHQQNLITYRGAPVPVAPSTAAHPGQVRRFIDGAARDLESPFSSIVHSSSQWVLHGGPALLALLLYGVGLGYLARFSNGSAGSKRRPTSAPYA